MNDNLPPVIKALHDLIVAWVRQVEHVPCMHRHTLGARIIEALLDAQVGKDRGRPGERKPREIHLARPWWTSRPCRGTVGG